MPSSCAVDDGGSFLEGGGRGPRFSRVRAISLVNINDSCVYVCMKLDLSWTCIGGVCSAMASPLFLVLVPAGVHAGMILSSLQRSIVIIIIIFIIIITIIIIIIIITIITIIFIIASRASD